MMHRYIEMTREMLLAKFKYDTLRIRLEGPRIGIIIDIVRNATGLTQRQLADRLGVHHTYLSKVVNDKAKAGLPLISKLYDLWELAQPMDELPLTQRFNNPACAALGSHPNEGQNPGDVATLSERTTTLVATGEEEARRVGVQS